MTLINLDYNLEDVKDSFEPLPESQYFARLTSCDLVNSSTGKPMLKVEWTIIDGEYEGRKVFDNVVLTVDWKVKQYCEMAGITSGSQLDTNDFIGIEALINVIQEEYVASDGESRITNRIKDFAASK